MCCVGFLEMKIYFWWAVDTQGDDAGQHILHTIEYRHFFLLGRENLADNGTCQPGGKIITHLLAALVLFVTLSFLADSRNNKAWEKAFRSSLCALVCSCVYIPPLTFISCVCLTHMRMKLMVRACAWNALPAAWCRRREDPRRRYGYA